MTSLLSFASASALGTHAAFFIAGSFRIGEKPEREKESGSSESEKDRSAVAGEDENSARVSTEYKRN